MSKATLSSPASLLLVRSEMVETHENIPIISNKATYNYQTIFEGSPVLSFLPAEVTEHPKPKIIREDGSVVRPPPSDDKKDVTFLQDFIAGGAGGVASIAVGHPFDTVKVRLQTSQSTGASIFSTISEFGGFTSLYRGVTAPLASFAFVNAVTFSSYGFASRTYNQYLTEPIYKETDDNIPDPIHDPWQKAATCGAFAGLVQSLIVCPMEHVKCRLQIQHNETGTVKYKGSIDATRNIIKDYGVTRLFQGWCSTAFRQSVSFAIFFATYDTLKDRSNDYLDRRHREQQHNNMLHNNKENQYTHALPDKHQHVHGWLASIWAGGWAGVCAWIPVYPIDVIKSRVQTSSLDAPLQELRMMNIGRKLVDLHGAKVLTRGLSVKLIGAFPMNGVCFLVYEMALQRIRQFS